MDIASLSTFITIAETRSFSQAAEQLHLTQPAISKRIAALESELNTQLFDRIGKRVSLTESGKALLSNARNILNELAESRRIIANLDNKVSGTLKLGISHHIGLHRLPPILKKFTADYPDVQLDIRFLDSEEGCRDVEHGDIELAIVTLPENQTEQLKLIPLWDDPLSIVVANKHPLYQQKIKDIPALMNYPAILPARGTYTRGIIEKAFAEQNTKLNITLETNYLETIRMMVAIGLGWSVLPRTMINNEIKEIQQTELNLQRDLGIVLHRKRTLSNAAKSLIALSKA